MSESSLSERRREDSSLHDDTHELRSNRERSRLAKFSERKTARWHVRQLNAAKGEGSSSGPRTPSASTSRPSVASSGNSVSDGRRLSRKTREARLAALKGPNRKAKERVKGYKELSAGISIRIVPRPGEAAPPPPPDEEVATAPNSPVPTAPNSPVLPARKIAARAATPAGPSKRSEVEDTDAPTTTRPHSPARRALTSASAPQTPAPESRESLSSSPLSPATGAVAVERERLAKKTNTLIEVLASVASPSGPTVPPPPPPPPPPSSSVNSAFAYNPSFDSSSSTLGIQLPALTVPVPQLPPRSDATPTNEPAEDPMMEDAWGPMFPLTSPPKDWSCGSRVAPRHAHGVGRAHRAFSPYFPPSGPFLALSVRSDRRQRRPEHLSRHVSTPAARPQQPPVSIHRKLRCLLHLQTRRETARGIPKIDWPGMRRRIEEHAPPPKEWPLGTALALNGVPHKIQAAIRRQSWLMRMAKLGPDIDTPMLDAGLDDVQTHESTTIDVEMDLDPPQPQVAQDTSSSSVTEDTAPSTSNAEADPNSSTPTVTVPATDSPVVPALAAATPARAAAEANATEPAVAPVSPEIVAEDSVEKDVEKLLGGMDQVATAEFASKFTAAMKSVEKGVKSMDDILREMVEIQDGENKASVPEATVKDGTNEKSDQVQPDVCKTGVSKGKGKAPASKEVADDGEDKASVPEATAKDGTNKKSDQVQPDVRKTDVSKGKGKAPASKELANDLDSVVKHTFGNGLDDVLFGPTEDSDERLLSGAGDSPSFEPMIVDDEGGIGPLPAASSNAESSKISGSLEGSLQATRLQKPPQPTGENFAGPSRSASLDINSNKAPLPKEQPTAANVEKVPQPVTNVVATPAPVSAPAPLPKEKPTAPHVEKVPQPVTNVVATPAPVPTPPVSIFHAASKPNIPLSKQTPSLAKLNPTPVRPVVQPPITHLPAGGDLKSAQQLKKEPPTVSKDTHALPVLTSRDKNAAPVTPPTLPATHPVVKKPAFAPQVKRETTSSFHDFLAGLPPASDLPGPLALKPTLPPRYPIQQGRSGGDLRLKLKPAYWQVQDGKSKPVSPKSLRKESPAYVHQIYTYTEIDHKYLARHPEEAQQPRKDTPPRQNIAKVAKRAEAPASVDDKQDDSDTESSESQSLDHDTEGDEEKVPRPSHMSSVSDLAGSAGFVVGMTLRKVLTGVKSVASWWSG